VTIGHAIALSRSDYCNSLLAGSPSRILDKLQCIQNQLVKIAVKHLHMLYLFSQNCNISASPTAYRIPAGCHHVHHASIAATAILNETCSCTRMNTCDKILRWYFKTGWTTCANKLVERRFSVVDPATCMELNSSQHSCLLSVLTFKTQSKILIFANAFIWCNDSNA